MFAKLKFLVDFCKENFSKKPETVEGLNLENENFSFHEQLGYGEDCRDDYEPEYEEPEVPPSDFEDEYNDDCSGWYNDDYDDYDPFNDEEVSEEQLIHRQTAYYSEKDSRMDDWLSTGASSSLISPKDNEDMYSYDESNDEE